ncbi:MAG: epoxyqueuosine reductase QueH [Clostridiales bacterium]|nr:epoxyqueuosine reductase QueH [Clostridiales bacterium]
MNFNYDRAFEKVKGEIDVSSPPRLLLHACCAPCSTYCLTQLLQHFDVTLYYANDNITDCDEWSKRLHELYKLVEIVNGGKFVVQPIHPLKLATQDFDNSRFFNVAKGLENEREGGARCKECFVLRLSDTLQFATDNGYDYFGTTLSVSPYKNSQLLNEIGLSLQTTAVKWLPADFKKRDGYKQSIELSQKYGLYRQHYCGCVYSLAETTAKQ